MYGTNQESKVTVYTIEKSYTKQYFISNQADLVDSPDSTLARPILSNHFLQALLSQPKLIPRL